MKKILVIANLFHASPRIPGLMTYLLEHDWEATIITPPLGDNYQAQYSPPRDFFRNVKIVEVAYRGDIWWLWRKILALAKIKKEKGSLAEQIKVKLGVSSQKSWVNGIMHIYEAIFGFPDAEKYWVRPVIKYIEKNFKQGDFEVVLSSAPYFASHIAAARIAKVLKIPWVADYRDPWSNNFNYPFGKIRKILDCVYEKNIMKTVSHIITVTPTLRDSIGDLLKKPVSLITNGFDQQLFANSIDETVDEDFDMIFAGKLYEGKRDPTNLLIAVKELMEEKRLVKNFKLFFYGPVVSWMDKKIKKHNLENYVFQKGNISRTEVLKLEKKSQILLMIGWGSKDDRDEGVYSGKIFEYFGLYRPIFFVGGPNKEIAKDLIYQTKTGKCAVEVGEIKEVILDWQNEYLNKGQVQYNGDFDTVSHFSYSDLSLKVVEMLNKIIKLEGTN